MCAGFQGLLTLSYRKNSLITESYSNLEPKSLHIRNTISRIDCGNNACYNDLVYGRKHNSGPNCSDATPHYNKIDHARAVSTDYQ